MKIPVMITAGFLVAGMASAAIVDDFDRADGAVGVDWTPGGIGTWSIESNEINQIGGNADASYLINTTSAAITSTEVDSFTVSAEMSAGDVGDWTGLVWNYQDDSNYQFFRFRWGNGNEQLEVGQVVAGTQSLVGAGASGLTPLFLSQTATFSIAYDGATSEYTVNMPVLGGSGADKNLTTFDESLFTGVATSGQSGLYSLFLSDAGNVYDNFSVSSIPEPANAGLLLTAAAGVLVVFRRKRS